MNSVDTQGKCTYNYKHQVTDLIKQTPSFRWGLEGEENEILNHNSSTTS